MAHPLQTILELEYATRSYSGRGMFGKTCLGVVINGADLGKLIAHVLMSVDDPYHATQMGEAFECMRTDDMGLDMIVYFPRVAFDDSEAESDDETDESDD